MVFRRQQVEEQQVEDDESEYTPEEWQEMMTPIIIEAMLDGRLPCGEVELSHAIEAGLELGICVEDDSEHGYVLSRDLEIAEELQLAHEQAEAEGLQLGVGSVLHRGQALVQQGARAVGRTARRAVNAAKSGYAGGGMLPSRGVITHAGRAAGQAARGIRNNAGALAVGGAAGFAAGRMSNRNNGVNPLVASAERRAAK